MSAAEKLQTISVEDYLAGELVSEIKHEYVGGFVHAMAGAGNAHNVIATNTLIALGYQLREKACQAFNSDTKVRIQTQTQWCFYYPDAMVVCEPNSPSDSFQDNPIVVVEVLSPSTRRIDMGEKKDAYLTLNSLKVYLRVEQDMPAVTAYRRTPEGFVREIYKGLDTVIPLEEIDIELPLAEVYRKMKFA